MSRIYLGEAYQKGIGLKADPKEAERWFSRGTESNSAYAYYLLGRHYFGTAEYMKAQQAFQVAASKEYAPAITMLGLMYLKGLYFEKNIDRAVELFEEANASGHLPARGYLSSLLIHGNGGIALCGQSRVKQMVRGLGLWLSGWRYLLFSRADSDQWQ